MPRAIYPEETRARVLAALLEGQSVSKIAAEYKLPEGTVKSWANRMRKDASELRRVAPDKKGEIGELLLRFMRGDLETLIAQQAILSNPEWLKKQTASDMAVLRGVTADKVFRMFEAFERARLEAEAAANPQLPPAEAVPS